MVLVWVIDRVYLFCWLCADLDISLDGNAVGCVSPSHWQGSSLGFALMMVYFTSNQVHDNGFFPSIGIETLV